MVSACSNNYTKIVDELTSKPDYFLVCVNDFDDRRHGECLYMPIAISVWHLGELQNGSLKSIRMKENFRMKENAFLLKNGSA